MCIYFGMDTEHVRVMGWGRRRWRKFILYTNKFRPYLPLMQWYALGIVKDIGSVLARTSRSKFSTVKYAAPQVARAWLTDDANLTGPRLSSKPMRSMSM